MCDGIVTLHDSYWECTGGQHHHQANHQADLSWVGMTISCLACCSCDPDFHSHVCHCRPGMLFQHLPYIEQEPLHLSQQETGAAVDVVFGTAGQPSPWGVSAQALVHKLDSLDGHAMPGIAAALVCLKESSLR